MMRLFVVLLACFFMINSVFSEGGQRRQKILSIVDSEIKEIKTMIKMGHGSRAENYFRLAELNLEKARLVREDENGKYLSIPINKRSKVNKRKFFEASGNYYKQANYYCKIIIKRYPRYKALGDVYYMMAFNEKELGNDKNSMVYFNRATKRRTQNPVVQLRAQIALAEMYYNKRDYHKAINLYEKTLKRDTSKWWTKDAFNLAWSYFRVHKYRKSIDLMERIFRKSSSSKYIDMRTEVERDIGLVYAAAGKIDEGIRFYKKIGINFTDQLLRIAVKVKGEGKYQLADKVLENALKYERRKNKKAEIYIEQLDLFRKFGKTSKHLGASKILVQYYKKGDLTGNQRKTLAFNLGKMAAVLQKQVAGKTYKRLTKIRKRKANWSIEYFGLLSELEKPAENMFFQGETAFAIEDYLSAFRYYDQSYKVAEKNNNKEILKKSLYGMLACAGHKSVERHNKGEYLTYIYSLYLKEFPTGKKSKTIYEKLFRIYLDQRDYAKAKNILDSFVVQHPKDVSKQEAMIANLMEPLRKMNQFKLIKQWYQDIEAGKYRVSKKYKNSLKKLLTSIKIKEVQQSLRSGDKKKALIGYHNILEDKFATDKSKKNAMYNLSALYFELGDVGNSYLWAIKSIKEMGHREVAKFSDSFLAMANYYFSKLEFKKSASLSQLILGKICRYKTRYKSIAFKNSAYLYLADGDIQAGEEVLKLGGRCNVSKDYQKEFVFELIDEYVKQKRWHLVDSYILKIEALDKYEPRLIYYYDLLSTNTGKNYSKKIWKNYSVNNSKKRDVSARSLDVIGRYKLDSLKREVVKVTSVKLKFPEKTFNYRLKKKLKLLGGLIGKANDVQKVGSGGAIIRSFLMLQEAYNDVAKEIQGFFPPNKSKDYIASFQKSMQGVYLPLYQSASQYLKNAKESLEKYRIIAEENFLVPDESGSGIHVRYLPTLNGVLMDRNGGV